MNVISFQSDSSSSDGITNLYNHRACRVRPSQLINSHRHSNSRNRQLPAFVSSFSLLGQLDSFARQHQFAPIAPSIRKVARAPEVSSSLESIDNICKLRIECR